MERYDLCYSYRYAETLKDNVNFQTSICNIGIKRGNRMANMGDTMQTITTNYYSKTVSSFK